MAKKTPEEKTQRRRERIRAQADATNSAYAARQAVLSSMGFDSYQDYLKSTLWARIRSRTLLKSQVCCVCDGPATQVHHGRYELRDLDGSDAMLFSICPGCHKGIEFKGAVKLTPEQATEKLLRIVASRKRYAKKIARIGRLSPPSATSKYGLPPGYMKGKSYSGFTWNSSRETALLSNSGNRRSWEDDADSEVIVK